MLRALVFVLGTLLGMGTAWAQAAAPASPPASGAGSPYAATVPVAGTSDAQRSAAIAAALTQVLQQVSPGFAAGPDVLAKASGFVRNYRYQRAAAGAGLQLQVEFDPGAVGRLVKQAGAAPAGAVASGAPAASAGPAAAPAPAGGTGTVWISGIDGAHAYADALALLRGDAQLHDVVPIAASGDGMLLQVGFDAPLASVLAALERPNGHLSAATTPHAGADASLRWTP